MQAFGHRAGFGKFVPWEFTETLQGCSVVFTLLVLGAGNIEVGIVGSAGNKTVVLSYASDLPNSNYLAILSNS